MTIPRSIAVFLCALPWFAAIAGFAWFVEQRFPLSGELHLRTLLDGNSTWFDPFMPGDRVTPVGPQPGAWIGQRVWNDPVYGGIRRPGVFDSVDLGFDVRPTRQSLIEIGVLRDPTTFSFDMAPLWSEPLTHGWHPVAIGNRRGFVRDGVSDAALVSDDSERLLVWRATTTIPSLDDVPTPERAYTISLRGSQDVFAVPTHGLVRFRFTLQDMNRAATTGNTTENRGSHAHVVTFRLLRGDALVWSDAIGTDAGKDGRPGKPFDKIIAIAGLAPGVYRLSILGDDDLFIRAIATTARRWVLGPRVFFGDTVGYRDQPSPVRVWTNSRHLVIETLHQEGEQTVSLGAASVHVMHVHTSYQLDRRPDERAGRAILSIPVGDMRTIGDGYVALAPDALFLPSARRLTDASDPVGEGVDAVITNADPPQPLGDGWWRVHATFSLSLEEDRSKLIFSTPGIVARNGSVDVRAISLVYRRPPLTRKQLSSLLTEEMRVAWRRIRNSYASP